MNYSLEIYRIMLTSVKRGRSKVGYSKAKPLFLITLIDFVPFCKGKEIPFGDTIFADFYKNNKEFFAKDCVTPLEVPFYHLQSESFYNLVWKCPSVTSIIKHTPSAKFLREHLLYAKLDDDLWELLQDQRNREYLKNAIINQYLKD